MPCPTKLTIVSFMRQFILGEAVSDGGGGEGFGLDFWVYILPTACTLLFKSLY